MKPTYAALCAFAGTILVMTVLTVIAYELGYSHPEFFNDSSIQKR